MFEQQTGPLDAVILTGVLREYHEGRRPYVSFDHAEPCLRAMGRPLSAAQIRDLMVKTFTLGGRAVAPLSDFVTAADDYIKQRAARPNLKAQAAAKARAARGRKPSEAAA